MGDFHNLDGYRLEKILIDKMFTCRNIQFLHPEDQPITVYLLDGK